MSYVMTLHPGPNSQAASKAAARYVIDRWMPDNRGGVHVLFTPKLADRFFRMWQLVNRFDRPAMVRVTIEGNLPVLTVLSETYAESL